MSGSYSPGDIYFFKGLERGAFAPAQPLKFANVGNACVGVASSVAVADWDRDGKLDLIVGNIEGEVFFLRNESEAGALVFGAKRLLIVDRRRDSPRRDAGPRVADWDGDGIDDLLVGWSDGSVTFFKAGGKSGMPELAEGVDLVAPIDAARRLVSQVELDPDTGRPKLPPLERSMMRSKPAVYDWNGDGKPDLLVGDVMSVSGPEPKLSAEDLRTKGELERRLDAARGELTSLVQSATNWAKRQLVIDDEWESLTTHRRIAEKRADVLKNDARYRELEQETQEIPIKLASYRKRVATHGFVWVYLRK